LDLGFHQFLVSSVSAYPVFRKAAQGKGSVGSLILEGVAAWREWNLCSNTHFGSLVLMLPLACAAGIDRPEERLHENLARILQGTTVQDAVDFYEAFHMAGARVAEVEEFSLRDPRSAERLHQDKKTLLDLMRLSQGHDLVAKEWSTNYERSFLLAKRLTERIGKIGLNDGIVMTFLEALNEIPDSLICAKFGPKKAHQVSLRAGEALQDPTLDLARQMDRELLAEDVNPGSTADLIAASLFISLLKGLRF